MPPRALYADVGRIDKPAIHLPNALWSVLSALTLGRLGERLVDNATLLAVGDGGGNTGGAASNSASSTSPGGGRVPLGVTASTVAGKDAAWAYSIKAASTTKESETAVCETLLKAVWSLTAGV